MLPVLKHFSFTKNEIKVIVFVSLVIVTGFCIKYYKQVVNAPSRDFDYSKLDEVFYQKTNQNYIPVSDSLSEEESADNDEFIPVLNDKEQEIAARMNISEDSLESTIPQTGKKSKKEENLKGKTININTALKEELIKLPGVGESTAEKIILFRDIHKGFKKIEEMMKIRGIGKKKFAKMKLYITLE